MWPMQLSKYWGLPLGKTCANEKCIQCPCLHAASMESACWSCSALENDFTMFWAEFTVRVSARGRDCDEPARAGIRTERPVAPSKKRVREGCRNSSQKLSKGHLQPFRCCARSKSAFCKCKGLAVKSTNSHSFPGRWP